MDNSESTIRHKQISSMFLKMGHALVDEGFKNNDNEIATLGKSMVFMSTLIFDKEDIKLFGQLCDLMVSRRLIKRMANGDLDFTKLSNLKDNKNTYQEILRRIKKNLDDNDAALNE